MKIAVNVLASLACLLVVGGAVQAAPPVLPEVTTEVAAFHPGAVAAVAASVAALSAPPVLPAYRHHAVGYLAIETPVGQTPDRPQDNTPSVLGRLEFPRLVGSFGLFAAGKLQTKKGLPYSKENSACVGIEAAVFHDWTAYTYAERRFDVGANRFMAGVRYNFNVGF